MNGQIKTDARLADLAVSSNAVLVLQRKVRAADKRLAKLDRVERVETFTSPDGYPAYRVISDHEITPAIYDLARQEDWPVRELRREVLTLETIFNQLATAA